MAGDLRIGKLRDRIDVARPNRTEDASTGEILIAWETVARGLPAEIKTSQAEREAGSKQTQTTRHAITVRYRSDLAGETDRRLIVDGIACEITASIDPDRRRRWLQITAIATQ
ncbi:Phage head-tail joining protein [Allorhodopirellula heiligendammensis]|uniref:Phage head-tail joining protein n=2 Tax=Allorhodopirellula heiligendammensis TaxID=2714739 RepID=A0A5C6C9U9_9BACT|nr:Phage head-tail joining protein [Allorhodopirellula heiligendammensis]